MTSAQHSLEHSDHNIPKSHIRNIAQNYVSKCFKIVYKNINPQKPSRFKYSVCCIVYTSDNRVKSSQIAKLAKQVPNIGLQNEQTGVLPVLPIQLQPVESVSCGTGRIHAAGIRIIIICKALSGLPARKIWFQLDGFSFSGRMVLSSMEGFEYFLNPAWMPSRQPTKAKIFLFDNVLHSQYSIANIWSAVHFC